MAVKTKIEQIAETTGETVDNVSAALSAFHSQKRTKSILQASIGSCINDARMALEKSKVWDEIKELQGKIAGLKMAEAALNVGQEGK